MVYEITLTRAVERGDIKEWHYDTEGDVWVTTPDDRVLRIPGGHIESFCVGMLIASRAPSGVAGV